MGLVEGPSYVLGMALGSLQRLWGEAGTSHTQPFISRISKPQQQLIRPPHPTRRAQQVEAPPAERSSGGESSAQGPVQAGTGTGTGTGTGEGHTRQLEHSRMPWASHAPLGCSLRLQRVSPALATRPFATRRVPRGLQRSHLLLRSPAEPWAQWSGLRPRTPQVRAHTWLHPSTAMQPLNGPRTSLPPYTSGPLF